MNKKQNRMKRVTVAIAIMSISIAGTFSASWKKADANILYKKDVLPEKVFERIIEVSDHSGSEVFLRKQNGEYYEYVFVDDQRQRQAVCLMPVNTDSNLPKIIEIVNLSTGDMFFDAGLDGFDGNPSDTYSSFEKDFDSRKDVLDSTYKTELQAIWVDLFPQKMNM